MDPIDRPFRFTWDFCAVWAVLAVTIFFLSRQWDIGPWYSRYAFDLVVPFIATFFIYGPVLFVRQIISSGSRGWFVARVFVTIAIVVGLFFFGLHMLGHERDISDGWVFVVASVAGVYLHWRIDGRNR